MRKLPDNNLYTTRKLKDISFVSRIKIKLRFVNLLLFLLSIKLRKKKKFYVFI